MSKGHFMMRTAMRVTQNLENLQSEDHAVNRSRGVGELGDTGVINSVASTDSHGEQAQAPTLKSKKKAMKIHNPDVMKKAIEALQGGATLRRAATLYNIPKTTLQRHHTGEFKGYNTSFGRPRLLNEEEENALHGYALTLADLVNIVL